MTFARICLLLPAILLTLSSLGQGVQKCGTSAKHIDQSHLKKLMTPPNTCNFINQANRTFQVAAHVAWDTLSANQCVTIAQVEEGLAELSAIFSPIDMTFELCQFEIMPDFHFFDWKDTDDQYEATIFHYLPNVINMYFVDEVETEEFGVVGGYAVFPGGSDIIVLGCPDNEFPLSVAIHEMGHFFGLWHTFEEDFGIELADGSNCDVAGDFLCDTEADPQGSTDDECEFLSPLTDPEGNFYTPPIDNYMSYYHDDCTCRFTIQQFNTMVEQYQTIRFYLW